MTIFSRLSDIVNANLNALLDRAEDPAKLIRLVIQEMEDTLVEVRSGVVRVIAERRELERRIASFTRERDDWEAKATFALNRQREDLARAALVVKAQVTASLTDAQAHLAHVVEGLEAQSADIGKLQAKLADAKLRERSLINRRNTAQAQLKLRGKLHDARVGDALAKFETIESSLDELEGKVESYDLGQTKTLADEFAALAADDQVESELAALKARLKPNNETEI
ncbi:MAG: phage shock protein PspA [Acidocella sp.]|nr:phage shock protein PspA [Acidocella sp.]